MRYASLPFVLYPFALNPNPLPFFRYALCPLRYAFHKEVYIRSEKVAKEILSLPMFSQLTNEQIVYVVSKIKNFLAANP
jgi:dTDP-4-amino-4,6-dideoxygalactose transaminase